jgi:radical SAM-linked protein
MEVESVKTDLVKGEEDGRHRYRLVFAKISSGRFLSHLEMATVLRRAMRRAQLPLAYSKGYNPTPRISFEAALPLGLESRVEEMEVILRQPVAVSKLRSRLNNELPAGLEILEAKEQQHPARQEVNRVVTYEATLPRGSWPSEGFRRFKEGLLPPLRQRSKRGEIVVALEERMLELEALDPSRIRFSLTHGGNGNIRVRDLLVHIFDLSREVILETRIVKISSEPMEG